MHPIVRLACLGGMAGLLAACQATNYGPPPQLTRLEPRDPVQGEWVDPNGIVSTFQGGRFETRTTDTNSVLATGQYQLVSDRMVAIDLMSRLRGTTSNVNCAIISPSQLNCTSDDGSQFSLARRAAG